MPNRPGGAMVYRPLHFIWIVDCSSSMKGEKIESLNTIIRNLIPNLQEAAQDHPTAQVMIRVIKFSNGAQWHLADPTPLADFTWTDLSAGGATDMGHAFLLLAEQFKQLSTEKGLRPVLTLLSDGYPTDDFSGGLKVLLSEAWGEKSIRFAIGIGNAANDDILQQFMSEPKRKGESKLKPFRAKNATDLRNYIQWVSTYAIQEASQAYGFISEAESFPDAPTIPNEDHPELPENRW